MHLSTHNSNRSSRGGGRGGHGNEGSLEGSPRGLHGSASSETLKAEISVQSTRSSVAYHSSHSSDTLGSLDSVKHSQSDLARDNKATPKPTSPTAIDQATSRMQGLGITSATPRDLGGLTALPSKDGDEGGDAPSKPKAKRSKGAMCGNCGGNHKLVDCPNLSLEGMGNTSTFGAVAQAANAVPSYVMKPETNGKMGAGTDTLLRIKFTKLHNQAGANSTTAYLGDEPSVHRGASGFFGKLKGRTPEAAKLESGRDDALPRKISSIIEVDEEVSSPSSLAVLEMAERAFSSSDLREDIGTAGPIRPLLPSLQQVDPEEFSDNHWLLSSIIGSCEDKLLANVFADAITELSSSKHRPQRRASVILAEGLPVAARVSVSDEVRRKESYQLVGRAINRRSCSSSCFRLIRCTLAAFSFCARTSSLSSRKPLVQITECGPLGVLMSRMRRLR